MKKQFPYCGFRAKILEVCSPHNVGGYKTPVLDVLKNAVRDDRVIPILGSLVDGDRESRATLLLLNQDSTAEAGVQFLYSGELVDSGRSYRESLSFAGVFSGEPSGSLDDKGYGLAEKKEFLSHLEDYFPEFAGKFNRDFRVEEL